MTASRANRHRAGLSPLAAVLSVGIGLAIPTAALSQTLVPQPQGTEPAPETAPQPTYRLVPEQAPLNAAPAPLGLEAQPAAGETDAATGAGNAAANAAVGAPGPIQLVPLGLPDATETADEPVEIRSGIAVQSLQRIDPESVGVLDVANGGFPVDMWTGTPRQRIDALMARLPTAPAAEVQLNITRRLLLSRAAIPLNGDAGPPVAANVSSGFGSVTVQTPATQVAAADPSASENSAIDTPADAAISLLDLRLSALLEMGLLEDLDALIQAAPSRADDPDVQRLLLEARLLREDLPGACALTAAPPTDDLYWLKASVFCKALAGDSAGADFGATLIREEGGEDDQPFLNILDHLIGGKTAAVETLGKPDAIETAMMRVTGLPWPADAAGLAGPAVQRLIALAPDADPVARLEAAETFVAAGRYSADDLSALYTAVQFEPDMLSNALSGAEEIGGALGRALLYQAALSQENTVARAELLRKAFDIAKREGRTAVLNRVFLPLISSIPPQRELWWLADNAARALYLAGDPVEARAWAETLRIEALRDPVAEQDAIRLWAVSRLAGDRVLDRLGRDILDKWRDLQQATAPDEAVRRVTLLYSLLESLGEPVPEASWEALLLTAQPDFQRMPNASLSRAIGHAASGLRQGETVLLALVMLGDDGPASAAPQTTASVVQSLLAVGLPRDARDIALAAALGAGI